MSETQASAATEATSAQDAARLTCFVIGPIGDRFAGVGSEARLTYEESLQIWEEVIEAACAIVGLDPVRSDSLARAGEITEQIFHRLRDDDVVIADLTGANANVMYELGLRHTRDLLTIQIGEYGRLPFDINVIRTVQFSRSPRGLINARDELVEMLQLGLAGQYDAVSATRVWLASPASSLSRADVSNGLDTPLVETQSHDYDEDRPGFLDLVAAAEEEQSSLVAAAESIAHDIMQIGELAEQATEEMQQSDTRGAGMRGRVVVAARLASNLDTVAAGLEDHVSQYVASMAAVSSGNLALIERLEQDPDQLTDVQDWALMLRRMAKTSREGLASLNTMSSSMLDNARLSRVLRAPTRRITTAFEGFAAATADVDSWDRRLQALGVPVPDDDWEPEADETAGGTVSAPQGEERISQDAGTPDE